MRPSTTDLQWLACDVDLWLRKVCFAAGALDERSRFILSGPPGQRNWS
jgi:hypothetical protein